MVIKDRLNSLQRALSDDEDFVEESVENDVEMENFFCEVGRIREMIKDMEINVDKIDNLHKYILSTAYSEEQAKDQLNQMISDIQMVANRVRTKLRSVEHDYKNRNEEESNYTKHRMCETQHLMLTREFITVMRKYNQIQLEYRYQCKTRIHRQLQITGRETTDDELEEMLEHGNLVVFTQGVVTHTPQARQRLNDIQDRHADILKLEHSIKELHELFMDMAMLIDNQGDLPDRIEYHVEKGNQHIIVSGKALGKAKEFRSKAHRKQLMIFCPIIAVLTIGVIFCFAAIAWLML